VTEAPCCLSGRARSLDYHDHVAMIVHIESNPECRSVYRSACEDGRPVSVP
jgi:hypothetical protein